MDSGQPRAATTGIFPAGRIQPNLPGALGKLGEAEEVRDASGTGRIVLSAVGCNACCGQCTAVNKTDAGKCYCQFLHSEKPSIP